ncbi:hypothetical protein ACFVH7_17875 [Kitasatospora indigofera]
MSVQVLVWTTGRSEKEMPRRAKRLAAARAVAVMPAATGRPAGSVAYW